MLDEVDARKLARGDAQAIRQRIAQIANLSEVSGAVHDVRYPHPVGDCERSLTKQIGAGVPADGNVRYLISPDPADFETACNRLCRKSRPVLDAPEPLLFDGNYELAVAQENGRAVGVVRVDSKYVHQSGSSSGMRALDEDATRGVRSYTFSFRGSIYKAVRSIPAARAPSE